jgi:hypothetical protein
MKGYDADVHDFNIQHSLINIRYFVVVKTGILHRFTEGSNRPHLCPQTAQDTAFFL